AAEAVCSDFGFWNLEFGLGPTKASDRPESLTLLPIQNPKSKIQNTEVLDLLCALEEKSLVLVELRDGNIRYRMLETVREYGLERLTESGEADVVRRQHAAFFLALAEQGSGAESEPAQMDRLEREHDNLRAALAWCKKAVDSGQWSVVSPAGSNSDLSSSA